MYICIYIYIKDNDKEDLKVKGRKKHIKKREKKLELERIAKFFKSK